MKAAIVELRNKKAAALLMDGTVVIIPNRSYRVGQEIEYTAPVMKARRVAGWATGVAAAFCIGLGIYAYQAPYTYISVDVNPSIEFSLNRFDQVLHVVAVNADAQTVVEELNREGISHHKIEEVLELTIKNLSEEQYFKAESGYLIIAAASENTEKAEQLTKTLEQTALRAEGIPQLLTVETITGKPEQVQEARQAGVTLGRKQLIDKIKNNADTAEPFAYEEWLDKPVKEIVQEAKRQDNRNNQDNRGNQNNQGNQGNQDNQDQPGKQNTDQPIASPAPEPSKTPKPSKGKDPEKGKAPQSPPSGENKGRGGQSEKGGNGKQPEHGNNQQNGGNPGQQGHQGE